MITRRINHWDYENEELAQKICCKLKLDGKEAWVKGSVVYWYEDSTD
jgi:hypothetical protein